ncbi:hypothetical protein ABIF63_000304 [Bradyrhizobium japonicum]|uniref:Uncharacterized protein n=1 Tax=Bradyrhizobium japonicum TaxID=375 RepID=A0ABV2RH00_BRAJP
MDMRRRQAIGAGVATALTFASVVSVAAASETATGAKSEPQDAWLDQGGRRHRIVFDTISATGLGFGMRFADNFFEANELSVVIIVRHMSTPLIFNDHIWDKYGDFLIDRTRIFDPRTKAPPRSNLYNIDLSNHELPNRNVKLTDLSKLGARFAVCALASKDIAIAVAQNVNGDADAILKELEANLVSDTALMVPADILTVNRAQEHGYTFSYCG